MAPDITVDELDKEVLEELRSLPGDLADLVGRHLVAAERALEEDDPDQAHEHTKVARRFAARIGVVREAAGIVAYRAGHFSEALSDLRAAKRMTGSEAYLAVMADCERGLGRPERAIDLVRSPEAERLDRDGRIELTIVESGARRDLGQHDAAVITLQRLPELRDPQPKPWSARLAFAYADALADAGHQEAATDWFGRAMAFDEDGETDAAERYAELTGAVIEDVEEDYDEEAGLDGAADDSDEFDEDFDGDGVSEVSAEADEDEDGVDDAAALAEAGDLLGSGDVLDEAPERDDSVVVPADEDSASEPVESRTQAVEDEAGAVEGESTVAGVGSDAQQADVEPEPAQTGPEGAAETVDQGAEADSARGQESEAEPEAETARQDEAEKAPEPTEPPGITPAFIEPNFGDVLDDSSESPTDKPKND
ncbi:tetratricopeptide repeat protein [Nonomuraea fuscirosea]|uniref:tetratricopeptide repeat protein n=1 Tax=Nonomuraea fuscirosea TaxID=1291556 RepID=UPI0034476EBC